LADPAQPLKAGDEVSLEFTDPLYFDQAGNRICVEEAQGYP
jgi:multiple sugar transport system ATP-binding protein